jgi:hypothetical protein
VVLGTLSNRGLSAGRKGTRTIWTNELDGVASRALPFQVVKATRFRQLNEGWNAEPNAPEPQIIFDRGLGLLNLDFTVNSFIHDFTGGARATLQFVECWRYRLGPTNDEGWYVFGQCRFGEVAPKWGEFYEVTGDLLLDAPNAPSDWQVVGPPPTNSRHFLFYLRDSTFECDAADWRVILPRGSDTPLTS